MVELANQLLATTSTRQAMKIWDTITGKIDLQEWTEWVRVPGGGHDNKEPEYGQHDPLEVARWIIDQAEQRRPQPPNVLARYRVKPWVMLEPPAAQAATVNADSKSR